MSKVYVLQKDLPDVKAGVELVYNGTKKCYSYINDLGEQKTFYHTYVENNSEWFLPKECKTEVTEIREHSSIDDWGIGIETNNKIPPDKYPSIKKAIEGVLNDDFKWEMQEKLYTEKELIDAEEKAWKAARESVWVAENTNGAYDGDQKAVLAVRYASFSDYKNDKNK